MNEAELKFEREERGGIVAVGTYLYDAARRMGVEIECKPLGESDDGAVFIKAGAEFLSQVTEREKTHLTDERRANGERLARQVKIESAGEIIVMTHEKKKEEKPKEEVRVEEYRKQFEELPLEKKIASLLELEGITLSETVSFVLNSPTHIVGKIMDVMAEFGLKIEDSEKKAKRPPEHVAEADAEIVDSENSEAHENGNGAKGKKSAKKSAASGKSDGDVGDKSDENSINEKTDIDTAVDAMDAAQE